MILSVLSHIACFAVGTVFGVMILALCVASRKDDDI